MTDDSDDAPRMMQIGPHTFVQWDTAVRLGLREHVPEQEVRASLARAAEIVVQECPAGPDLRVGGASQIVVAAPKGRAKPVRRPLSEILKDSGRVGPGPDRPRVHGG